MQNFDEYTLPEHEDGKIRSLDHAIGLLEACLKNTRTGIEEFVGEDGEDGDYSEESISILNSYVDELKLEEESIVVAIRLLTTVNNSYTRPLPPYPRLIDEHISKD